MEIILYYILCPLCVALIVALLVGYEFTRRASHKAETVSTELDELKRKLKQEAESFRHIANQLAANYDQRVEGQEKKIEDIKLVHDEWKGVALHCMKALNRIKPGWVEKHLINGEPEYEIVEMRAPIKRPDPKPRASNIKKPPTDPSPEVAEEW